MGHLVNPISFRLGYTQFWKSRWFLIGNRTIYLKNLREDLVFFKFIQCFFESYKLLNKFDSFFLERELKKKSYLRPSQLKKFKLKQFLLVKFFKKFGLIYSHSFISRFYSNLNIALFLYDASYESFSNFEFNFSIFKYIKRLQKKIKKRFYNNFIPLKKIRNFNKRKYIYFLNLLRKKYKNLKKNIFLNFISNLNILFLKFKNKYISFINSIKFFKLLFFIFLNLKNKYNLLLFINRILIFFCLNFKNKIKNLLLIINKNFINRILLIKFLKNKNLLFNKIIIKLYFNLLLNFNYIKDFYFLKRFKFFLFISRIFYKDFNILKYSNYKHISLNILGLNNLNITANMLCNFISKRLVQKYKIFDILKPIVKDLLRNFYLYGFKISCAGRLTKKQRAGLIIEKKKSVPLSTSNSIIDYSMQHVILRHGVCGLKIWLHKKIIYKPFSYNIYYKY